MSDQTPTPRTAKAIQEYHQWAVRNLQATMRGSHLDSDDPKPPDGWATAIQLERELAAAISERDEARGNTERFRSSMYALEERVLELTQQLDEARRKRDSWEACCKKHDDIKPPECPCDPDNGTPLHDHPDCAPTSDPEAAAEALDRALTIQMIEQKKRKLQGRYTEVSEADIELARLRAEVQALREENNDLRIGQTEVLSYLKSLHEWFLAKAPEYYKGCGLWIDVDITLKAHADDAAIRAAMRKEGE